jgi:hypothetical protein
MSSFRHHPDGLIYISDGQSEPLAMPLDEFLIDEPEYQLPEGYIGCEYIPGKRWNNHTHNHAVPQIEGDVVWEEGDRYIANLATYRANYEARHQPDPPTQDELDQQAKMTAATDAVNTADVTQMVQTLGAATTVTALRDQVTELTRLVGNLAVALGFTPKVEEP